MRSMISILIAIAGGYCIILLFMFLFQNHLLFMPTSGFMQTPESAGLEAEDIWVVTEDGVKLHAWYFPHEESDRVIVLSHGNAGNISYRLDIAGTLLKAGAAVLMYDYRGYGQSEGRPSEEGLYKDISAVIEYLKTEKGYPDRKVYMYGRSLGAAVAAYAATKYDLGGLVLDSAFKNLRAMIQDVYPFVPSSLARYEFPTEKYLRQLQGMPVMIMHSPNDEIVGFHNSQYLYEIANEPKQFVELRGGHNDNFYTSRHLIERSWREFLVR
jgi:uncharacterized protein